MTLLFPIDYLCCIVLIVPSSPPLNVRASVLSSTSIRVRWNVIPEELRNGIIRRYDVMYRYDGQESNMQNVTSTEVILMNLAESELYSIQVRGVTSIGEGPYSMPPATAMTREDSK